MVELIEMESGERVEHKTGVGVSPADAEIVIGLVCPLGTDVRMVQSELTQELHEYDFTSSVHRLSGYLAERCASKGIDLNALPLDERLDAAMTAGDELRQDWDTGDALVLWAISDVVATREADSAYEAPVSPADQMKIPAGLSRHAFILRSLKTEQEVLTLRAVYGSRFVLVGVYAPQEQREQHLTDEIRASRGNKRPTEWTHRPQELIDRDWDEQRDRGGGQDVAGTFEQADFFIDATTEESARSHIVRTLEVLFGHPFTTPTRDEASMFAAQGAALRSAELGRQVGASICSPEGAILALGTNEVPRAGGGSRWDEDDPAEDHREWRFSGRDTNRVYQDRIADDVLDRIKSELPVAIEHQFGADSAERQAPVIDTAIACFSNAIRKQGRLRELTEYGRAVHAEMDALLDAARRGVAVKGATLYVTTFPCHTCARHIIASGIERVVYVSAYSKSRAKELHGDDLKIASSANDHRVSFEPFVGVAPRRYLQSFNAADRELLGHLPRKDEDANVQEFKKATAQAVITDLEPEHLRPLVGAYRQKELMALGLWDEKKAGL